MAIPETHLKVQTQHNFDNIPKVAIYYQTKLTKMNL